MYLTTCALETHSSHAQTSGVSNTTREYLSWRLVLREGIPFIDNLKAAITAAYAQDSIKRSFRQPLLTVL